MEFLVEVTRAGHKSKQCQFYTRCRPRPSVDCFLCWSSLPLICQEVLRVEACRIELHKFSISDNVSSKLCHQAVIVCGWRHPRNMGQFASVGCSKDGLPIVHVNGLGCCA